MAVYPVTGVIPENLLHMYIQFSGPMGSSGGLDHIALVDRAGQQITDALRQQSEPWSADRTRYTLLLEPGQIKRGTPSSRSAGRSLHRGQTFSFIVKTDWLDARGAPLKAEFQRQYRVGPRDDQPLSTLRWHIASPSAGTRGALTIRFPEPLDRVQLQRAISVSHAGAIIAGDTGIEPGETRWTFVPRDTWRPGVYTIVVQPTLEDLAGNRIGRAFGTRTPGEPVASDNQPVSVPFRISMPGAR